MNNILLPVAALGGLGVVFGILLGLAAKFLKVETDTRADEIMELLPGANCGGCGFAGCSALAGAIAKGEVKPGVCAVLKAENAAKISEIMGLAAEKKERKIARVLCQGTCDKASAKCRYEGIEDCVAASRYGGGEKACAYGCCGYGTCVRACNFDAIHLENGVAVVDPDKCVACGACVKACPRNIIELIGADRRTYVKCKSKEKALAMKSVCSVGCIACKICEKNCPTGAAKVNDNLASIDYETCTNCGICAEKCPKKVIAF